MGEIERLDRLDQLGEGVRPASMSRSVVRRHVSIVEGRTGMGFLKEDMVVPLCACRMPGAVWPNPFGLTSAKLATSTKERQGR
jgi:hypothetical protein